MIDPQQKQEWLDSGVDEALINLNVISLSGNEALEYVLFGLPSQKRRNDNRSSNKWLLLYSHVYDDDGRSRRLPVEHVTLRAVKWR